MRGAPADDLTCDRILQACDIDEAATHDEPADDMGWPRPRQQQSSDENLGIVSVKVVNEWPQRIVKTAISIPDAEHDWSTIALLSAPTSSAPQLGHALSLELHLGERQSVVRATPEIIPWPPSAGATAHVRAYYHEILPDGPASIAMVPLISHSGDIDWIKIQDVTIDGKSVDVPVWLPELCHRIASLQRLEQLGRLWAPVGPLPNPLRMEAVLACGLGSGKQAFQVLSWQGLKTISMMFALAFYVKEPFDDARQLDRRVKEAVRHQHLATISEKSGLLKEVTDELESIDMVTAANVITAVIGAFVGEKAGDFFSVVKLWQWLSGDALLLTSLCFLHHAPAQFKGRTQTCKTFKQVEVEGGILELHVDFEEIGEVRFRRPALDGKHPLGSFILQRDLDEGKKAWMSVQYDGSRVTFALMLKLDGCARLSMRVLPNKMQLWLRGVCAAALITTLKPSQRTTPPSYGTLRETTDGSLCVQYQKDWYVYTRCPKGGLGYERAKQSGEEHPLVYSESPQCKTLLSPCHNMAPLPKMIIDWLLSGKSLYQLPRIDCPKGTTDSEGVHVLEDNWNHIIWQSKDGSCWKCCRNYGGQGGLVPSLSVVFTAGRKDEPQKGIAYQFPENQNLAVPQVDGIQLPRVVLQWMTKNPEQSWEEKEYMAYLEMQQKSDITMCRAAPCQLPRFLNPATLDVAEEALMHKFANKNLLAEALSQTTRTPIDMNSNEQRLEITESASLAWPQRTEERRIAADGKGYTQKEFEEFYEGSWRVKWNDSPAASSPVAELAAADGVKDEKRVAKDGTAYTHKEFEQFYPDSWAQKWNEALPYTDLAKDTVEKNHVEADGKGCTHKWDLQRLAFVGNAVAEQLTVRILVANASFPTAPTLSQHDESSSDTTFAVGASLLSDKEEAQNGDCDNCASPEYQWPANAKGLTEGAEWKINDAPLGPHLTHPELLQKRLDACCNNIAYAKTCVELGLHKAMLEISPVLAKSVTSFGKVFSRAKQEESIWPRLLEHDAPRALGNTFIACLGAIIMDGAHGRPGENSAYMDVKRLLMDHIKSCVSLPIDVNSTAGLQNTEELSTESDQHGRSEIYTWSPRSAMLRAPYRGSEFDADSESDADDDEEKEQEGQQNDEKIDTDQPGGAVYCEYCEMWLNGPVQWEDHKIGKKHRKNKRKSVAKPDAKEAALASSVSKQDVKGGAPSPPMPAPKQDVMGGAPPAEGRANLCQPAHHAAETHPEYTTAPPPYGYPPPGPNPYYSPPLPYEYHQQWYGQPPYGYPPPPYGYPPPPAYQ